MYIKYVNIYVYYVLNCCDNVIFKIYTLQEALVIAFISIFFIA